MQEFKLYTLSDEEIIDAFKKEGVEVSYVDGDKGCIYPEFKNKADWEKLDEKFQYPIEQIIAKNALGLGDDMTGYLFGSDGNQILPGRNCFIPVPLSEYRW